MNKIRELIRLKTILFSKQSEYLEYSTGLDCLKKENIFKSNELLRECKMLRNKLKLLEKSKYPE